jgi:hypothetical protein
VTEIQPELASRLLQVGRAIDNALVASHALRAALKPGHPPFDAPDEAPGLTPELARADEPAAADV